MQENLYPIVTLLLIDLGAPREAEGFGHAVELITHGVLSGIAIESRCELFENWGTTFGDTPTKIERCLYYVKATCFERKTETFKKIFGGIGELSVYGFLETLRVYIMENVEEELWQI